VLHALVIEKRWLVQAAPARRVSDAANQWPLPNINHIPQVLVDKTFKTDEKHPDYVKSLCLKDLAGTNYA